jgi:hypothetical protein
MVKGIFLFSYILIIIGVLIFVFTALFYFNEFTLMEHLPAIDQYLMAGILALLFIGIGFMMLKEEKT